MRSCLIVITLLVATLIVAGCGGSGETVTTGAAVTETTAAPTTSSAPVAVDTPDTEGPDAGAPSAETATGDGRADGWETVATLRSSDSPWQGLEGVLVSDPFAADGELQVVLDMADTGELPGVLVAVVPADMATDATSLIAALDEGTVLLLMPAKPSEVIPDLRGTYVLVNSVPGEGDWSVEAQTRP